MVCDEFNGDQWVNCGGVAAKVDNRIAHRGEIDHRWDSREVLHKDALWGKRDFSGSVASCFAVVLRVTAPLRKRCDVGSGDFAPVFMAEKVFEKDFD